MNSRFYWLIVVLILGSIAMGACTAAPAPTATLAPKPTATAPAATQAPKPIATGPGGFPLGIFKPDPQGISNYMMFTANGTFIIGLPGGSRLGTYVVNGDQIVFNASDGPCVNYPGTYHWELHGNSLTLKPVNETCPASMSHRSEDMVGRSWILQP